MKRLHSERSFDAIVDEIFATEVARCVKTRRLVDTLCHAAYADVVRDTVSAVLPPLHSTLEAATHERYHVVQRISWENRKASQRILPADTALLETLGWDGDDTTARDVPSKQSSLRKADYHTLSGSKWLNDAVIDAYLALIVARAKGVAGLPKSYSLGTHFATKLQATQGEYSAVERWTKRVSIFEYDLVFIPVNVGRHWSLAVIDFQNNTIGYYDSYGSESTAFSEILLAWLQEENNAKRGPNAPELSMCCVAHGSATPQQLNGFDCGVFVCMTANCIAAARPLSFSRDDMRYVRARMALELHLGKVVATA